MGDRRGRWSEPVVVTPRQGKELERLVAQGDARQRLRAQIVLGAAGGASERELARELGCSAVTVATWRGRFAEHGIAGLADVRSEQTGTAPPAPQPTALVLSAQDRAVLARWTTRPGVPEALALRARIVLAAAEGASDVDVAARVGCTAPTAGRWRRRCQERGIEALLDEPRVGAPRTVGRDTVEQIIFDTLHTPPPDGAARWSTRSMARHAKVSQPFVWRVWDDFGLKPHLVDVWRLSSDPQFVDRVRDVVGLYLDPPERALVLSADATAPARKTSRPRPPRPRPPRPRPAGGTAAAGHDEELTATAALLAALDAATVRAGTPPSPGQRTQELAGFLDDLDRAVPAGLDVHLILDGQATHETPEIQRWLLRRPRFRLHPISTGSSWLRLVEHWFGELSEERLHRADDDPVAGLTADVTAWTAGRTADPEPYRWVRTAQG